MVKYILLLGGLVCAGCQTTQTTTPAPERFPLGCSEKLLLRVDQVFETYDVRVQRVVLNGEDPKDREQWKVGASVSISGYPESWRCSDKALDVAECSVKTTYLLAGEQVVVAAEPGARLVAKVFPETQNTARVVGVFQQVVQNGTQLKTSSMPFDINCKIGEVVVLYQKDVAFVAEE